jgi:hypothetical protein
VLGGALRASRNYHQPIQVLSIPRRGGNGGPLAQDYIYIIYLTRCSLDRAPRKRPRGRRRTTRPKQLPELPLLSSFATWFGRSRAVHAPLLAPAASGLPILCPTDCHTTTIRHKPDAPVGPQTHTSLSNAECTAIAESWHLLRQRRVTPVRHLHALLSQDRPLPRGRTAVTLCSTTH